MLALLSFGLVLSLFFLAVVTFFPFGMGLFTLTFSVTNVYFLCFHLFVCFILFSRQGFSIMSLTVQELTL